MPTKLTHAKTLAREMVVETRTSDGATLKVPGVVPKLSATPGCIAHTAPRLGEHNEEVYASVGVDAKRIEELREQGVI